jgi:uncharacterized cupredoxin-like copper-binding protein
MMVFGAMRLKGREEMMSRRVNIGWFSAVIGVFVLALCVTGVSLAGVARQASAAKVTVTLANGTLRISNSNLEAGKTTFVVVNKASGHHALAITGPGLKNARTPKLAPGGTATLTVTLKAGAYILADPFGSGYYDVKYLDIAPSAVETASGSSSVVNTATVPAAMCSTPEVAP